MNPRMRAVGIPFSANLFWKIASLILIGALLASCNTNPTRRAPPPPGSWLVLLCRASDASVEPHPASYYEELFRNGQRDLLFDYFDKVSHHQVNVAGTEVFGWFPMSVSTADIAPSVRNNNTAVTRTQTARDCKASALGALAGAGTIVDPANYAGVLTVINVPVDAGDTGPYEKTVVASLQPENEVGLIAHEMLHVLGARNDSRTSLQDSTADHVWDRGDVIYEDCWDMMSFRTCVHTFDTTRGAQGTELQGAYRQMLGWMPANRVQVVEAYPSKSTQITLAPISDPDKPGMLLAEVEVPNRGYYVVEYRERSGFDKKIPYDAVVIREFRNKTTYLVFRKNGMKGWKKGDVFTDAGNYLSIKVDDIVAGAATVTINTGYSANSLHAGDMCGDKFRGQILACPAGTQCIARRLGSGIQSVDFYCL